MSGAVVQGEATKPDITPIMTTPAIDPPFCLLLILFNLFCQLVGKAKLKTPNIESARKINNMLNAINTKGC